MALVMKHHDIGIVAFVQIQSVGAEGTVNIDATYLRLCNGRSDDFFIIGSE